MKELLKKLYNYQTLSFEEAKHALQLISEGQVNTSQVVSFVTVYLLRNITVEELRGFRDVLLEKCVPVPVAYDVLDVCGTGGDEKNTFNISTLTAFVAAGAGVKVAKHGNYGVSSISGSSNMLEHFGYKFTNDTDVLKQQLDAYNICFMHAPLFHPALKNVAQVRKELGVKTFFNMLGPLVNPARPRHRLVGVYHLELARIYYYILQREDCNFHIIHAFDGYDEISLTGDFKSFSNKGEQQFAPADLKLDQLKAETIAGGDTVEESAGIFKKILEGKGSKEQNSVVFANAAFAIQAAKGTDLLSSVEMARESLLGGKALNVFNKLTT